MCDASTSKVFSPFSKGFREKAKVTEEYALKIALKSFPGKIEENTQSTYEIDIMSKCGVETKVEVDAVTGKIIEVSTEKWEIGTEEDESR